MDHRHRRSALSSGWPIIAAASLALVLAGCSTLEHGITDEVYVLSDPPGAKATATVSDLGCLTPCHFDVDRQTDLTVYVAKEGFKTASVAVKAHSTAPASATSRDVTVDYLGRVADAQNGADDVHTPNPVSVRLEPAK